MNPRVRSAVLIDQFPLWLDALERVLAQSGIDVVGRAARFSEALALLETHAPGFLVGEIHDLDTELAPGEFLERACAACPGLRIIVISGAADQANVDDALAAGAAVYVFKTATADDLRLAVGQVFDQSIYIANGQAPGASRRLASGDWAPAALTKRELEILRLVAEGHSNAQLARMLWVTEQTVKFHLSNIYRKLDVANRTEASRWAQVHNLLPVARKRSPIGA